MIMCAKVGQKEVAKAINELGEFSTRPEQMSIDPKARIYFKQYDLDYKVESIGQVAKSSDRLKLNIYFDPIRRSLELVELDIALSLQETILTELVSTKGIIEDDNTIRRDFCYYKVICDAATRVVKSFERNDQKITKARSLSGFFSIMTHGVDFDAMKTFGTYRLRDEQEKYFQQMKSQMVSDKQRNWSEEGKTGRLFILFVSLILSSYVRHIWKSTELYDRFSSSLEIADEMRSIRFVEHTNKAKMITPFVGEQIEICQAFGIDVPEGCSPKYVSRRKPVKKRGRPPKKVVELDHHF